MQDPLLLIKLTRWNRVARTAAFHKLCRFNLDSTSGSIDHAGCDATAGAQARKNLTPGRYQRPRLLVQGLEKGRTVTSHNSHSREALLDQLYLVFRVASDLLPRLIPASEYVVDLWGFDARYLVSRKTFRFGVEDRAVQVRRVTLENTGKAVRRRAA